MPGARCFRKVSPEGFEPTSRYRAELAPGVDSVVAKGLGQAPCGSLCETASEMALALEAAIAPATPSEIGNLGRVASPVRRSTRRARLIETMEDAGSV